MKLRYILIFLILFISIRSFSVTNTWIGGVGGSLDWQNIANWDQGHVPTTSEDVVFNTAGTLTFSTGLAASVSLNSLTISQGTVTLIGASSYTITLGGNAGNDLVISSGATLVISTNLSITMDASATSDISGTLSVSSGSTFHTDNSSAITTVSSTGIILNSGTITCTTAANIVMSASSSYTHSQNGGNIPTATWNSGSTCNVTGVTTTIPTGITTQTLDNLVWNCASQSSAINFQASFTIGGDFTVSNTGSSYLAIHTSTPRTLTVNGDVLINGGTFYGRSSGTSSGTSRFDITGNFTISSGTFGLFKSSGDGSEGAAMTVGGDFLISGTGLFDLIPGSYPNASTLTLSGDFTQTGGTFKNNYAGNGAVYFAKAGTQIFTQSSGTFTGSGITFGVNSGATLQLASNFTLTGGSLTVYSGGVLDIPSPYYTTGTGSTVISSGATLQTGHREGISSTASVGCIQTNTNTCNTGATYVYNGTSAQVTGNKMSTVANLTFDNPAGVTLSQNITVSNGGTLTLNDGFHNLSTYTLQLGTTAANTLVYNSGGLYSYVVDDTYGFFKRYIPTATTITWNSGNAYGLFPMSKCLDQLGYFKVTSTANTTAGGFISVSPVFGFDEVIACNVADGGNTIEQAQIGSYIDVTTTTIAGGTDITIEYDCGTIISSGGSSNALCLATYNSEIISTIGTHSNNTGSKTSPEVIRTTIGNVNLLNSNRFVLASYTGTSVTVQCQSGGTKTIGPTGDYESITAIFDNLKTYGLTTSMVLELQSTYDCSVETFPIDIQNFNCLGSSNTLTIRPAADATELVITGDNNKALINFNNCDYVTIDGRPGGIGTTSELTIINTNTTAPTVRFINDATNNTITYCSIQGSDASVTSGAVLLFSTTNRSTGNDNNTVSYNTFSKSTSGYPTNIIVSSGTNNKLNNGNVISYNNFTDQKFHGIYVYQYSDNFTINNNHFYQNSGSTQYTGINNTVSFVNMATGGDHSVNYNYFGGQATSCGGSAYTFSAAYSFYGILWTNSSGTNNIKGNKFQNWDITTTKSSGEVSMINTAGTGDFTIGTSTGGDENIIGTTTGTASITATLNTNTISFSTIYNTSTGSINIDYNKIGAISLSGTRNGGSDYMIASTGGINSISNNTIGNTDANNLVFSTDKAFSAVYLNVATDNNAVSSNTLQNLNSSSTGTTRTMYLINITTGTGSNTVSSNVIGNTDANNLTISGGTGITGILLNSAASYTVDNNYIQQINSTNASTSNIYGISMSNASSTITSCTGNYIRNITTAQISAKYFYGINMAGEGTVNGNYIQDISTSSNFFGIVMSKTSGTLIVSSNFIQGTNPSTISIGGTNTLLVYPIDFSGTSSTASVTCNNNTIDYFSITNNGASSKFIGIYLESGTFISCDGNTIDNISTAIASANNIGIKHLTSAGNYASVITNNTISNFTLSSTSGYFTGIWSLSTNASNNISTNTIDIISISATSTTVNAGIVLGSTGTYTCNTNVIQNITISGAGSTKIYGIHAVSTGTYNMNGNTINALTNTDAGASSGVIYGIFFDGICLSSIIEKNKITGLSITQTTSPIIYGIYADAAGTIILYNNFFQCNNGGNTNNCTIYGLYCSTTTYLTAYYNTWSISGSNSAGASHSACFYYIGATSNRISSFKNNILQNTRTSGGTGDNYCYYLGTAGAMTAGECDYNYYYATVDAQYARVAADKTETLFNVATQGYGGVNSVYGNPTPTNQITVNSDASLSSAHLAVVDRGADLSGIVADDINGSVGNRAIGAGYKGCYETAPPYYWNGANNSANPAEGGTGNWSDANNWRINNTGSQATWVDEVDANIAGTAGTITLSTDVIATNTTVSTTDYILATSGVAGISYTTVLALGTSNITFSPISGANLTLPGVISGSGAITKSAAGELILSASNTFTGNLTVTAGLIKLGATGDATNTPLGTIAGSTTISSSSALDLAGYSLGTAEPLTINGTGISSGGALLNSGAACNYSGLLTLGSSSSIIGGTGTIGLTNVGTITGSGYDLTLGGAQGGSITSIIGTGSGNLVKQDAGTWVLSGANTYTGSTTINSGILEIGASGVINDGSNIILNSGTLSTGSGSGYTETVGVLTLSSSSTINLGSGSHSLTFANSNGETWTGILTITGWAGSYDGTTGTSGQIFFGSDNTGVTSSQLTKIRFYDGSVYHQSTILVTGEVVPLDYIHSSTINQSATIISLSSNPAKFYDDGGVSSDYSNSISATTYTFNCAGGYYIRAKVNTLNFAGTGDILTVYNGNSTSSRKIGEVTSTDNGSTFMWVSTSGSLTFEFTSDGSGVGTGWDIDLYISTVQGQQWLGTTSSDLTVGSNWEGGVKPLAQSSIFIPSSYTNPPISTSAISCFDFRTESGSTFDFNGASLTVYGDVNIAASTITTTINNYLSLNGGTAGNFAEIQGSGVAQTYIRIGNLQNAYYKQMSDIAAQWFVLSGSNSSVFDMNDFNLTVANSSANSIDIPASQTFYMRSGTINTFCSSFTIIDASFDEGTGTFNYNRSAGNQDITNITYYNLSITGGNSRVKSLVGTTTVLNNLTVDASTELACATNTIQIDGTTDNNGTISISTGTIDANGNFDATSGNITFTGAGNLNLSGATITSFGTFTPSTSTVTFDGSSTQSITSGGTIFNNVYFFNTDVTGISLTGQMIVNGELSLRDGIINTSSGNELKLGNASTINATYAGSTDCYVDGPFIKVSNNTSEFTMPLGDNGSYKWVKLTPSAGGSDTEWTGRFYKTAHGNTSIDAGSTANINHVGQAEYWDISPSGANTSANIEICWDASSGVDDYSTVVICHFNTTAWEYVEGTLDGASSNASGSIRSDSPWGTWSPVAHGSSSASNPLKVEYVDFNSECIDGVNEITWITSSEVNSDYFSVENSENAIEFNELTSVNAAGYSDNYKYYTIYDLTPFDLTYYRLKQFDFNGEFNYSNVISEYCSKDDVSFELIDVITANSKEKGFITILFNSNDNSNFKLMLYDLNGKLINSDKIKSEQGFNSYKMNLSNISPGIYLFMIYNNEFKSTQKVVIN